MTRDERALRTLKESDPIRNVDTFRTLVASAAQSRVRQSTSSTARHLALQLRQPAIVQLLTMSLGEEQNAGQLLDQVARPLVSVAKMPGSVE